MGNSNASLLMPVKARPYYHQSQAFDFACEKFGRLTPYLSSNGVALLMEMGTGKTITSIGITGALYQFGKVNRVLIVCPLSIVDVWQQELESFADYPYNLMVFANEEHEKYYYEKLEQTRYQDCYHKALIYIHDILEDTRLTELPKHCDDKRYRSCKVGLPDAMVRKSSGRLQETTPLIKQRRAF